jgi:hypothetical protein
LSGGVNQNDKPILNLDKHFPRVWNFGRFRDGNVMAHGSIAQFPSMAPPTNKSTPAINIGIPSFNDDADRRRSSIRPETTTRMPRAENHKPMTTISRPTNCNNLARFSHVVTALPIP